MTDQAIPDVSDRSIGELISLEGRVAAVTGGARGIGEAICSRLAEAGAHVAVLDRDGGAADATAESLAAAHDVECIGIAVDVVERATVAAAADRIVEQWGGLDVWVNNAGVYPAAMLIDMTDEQWDQVLDVNLKGTFIGAQEAARRMISAGAGGVVVNIASISGMRSSRKLRGHYVASKHGVVGLTKSLAVELGGDGVRVLAVAPGTIMTPGIEEEAGIDPDWTSAIHDMGRGFPLGRIGTGDDIARVVLFCASDLAMFMTGETVVVDAGGNAVM